MTANRWVPVAAVTLLASAIAYFNRGERVAIDLGIIRFYRAPLTIVLFLAFLAGMLALLLLSLRQDRRLRDELRRRGFVDAPAPAPAVVPAADGDETLVLARQAPSPATGSDTTVSHGGSGDS